MSAEFYPGAQTLSTRFSTPNATPMSVGSPIGSGIQPMLQTPQATGADLPSPVTWLVAVLVLLYLLKVLGESDRTAINPAHIHIGGYNVLTIFVIVLISLVGAKILVNRPFFTARQPLAGFASLVNAA